MNRLEYIVVAVATLGIVFASEIESNFYYDEYCACAGGSCVLEKECPDPVEGEYKNYCTNQKGAVCCKNFPQDKLNCFQLHNACEETCIEKLDLGKKGCGDGKTCCVLV